MGKTFQVLVKGPRGETVTIDLCNTDEQMKSITVLQLKEKIAEKLPETAGEDIRLIFTDRHMEDDSELLSKYGVQQNSLIMMVLRVMGGLS